MAINPLPREGAKPSIQDYLGVVNIVGHNDPYFFGPINRMLIRLNREDFLRRHFGFAVMVHDPEVHGDVLTKGEPVVLCWNEFHRLISDENKRCDSVAREKGKRDVKAVENPPHEGSIFISTPRPKMDRAVRPRSFTGSDRIRLALFENDLSILGLLTPVNESDINMLPRSPDYPRFGSAPKAALMKAKVPG